MRKKLLLAILLLVTGAVVGQKHEDTIEEYVVQGELDGEYKADQVYLSEWQGPDEITVKVDSFPVVNNRYILRRPKTAFVKRCIIQSAAPNCRSRFTPFFLEEGLVSIHSNAEFFADAKINGGVNNRLESFSNYLNKYTLDSLAYAFSFLSEEEKGNIEGLRQRSELSNRRLLDVAREIAWRYNDQVFAIYVVSVTLANRLPVEEVKKFRNHLHPSLNEHPYMKRLDDYIRRAEFGVGSQMPDFQLPDKNDKMVHLKDFRGKYVLVDFWASWCGPCMQEMPNVVKLYKKYKGKKFEILGISLDGKKEAWLEAVKKLKMVWPQLCDLKGTATAPAKACNVKAIPYTILVDPHGKVIATELRGEKLQQTIGELFK